MHRTALQGVADSPLQGFLILAIVGVTDILPDEHDAIVAHDPEPALDHVPGGINQVPLEGPAERGEHLIEALHHVSGRDVAKDQATPAGVTADRLVRKRLG